MEELGGGSSTPSYSNVVSYKSREMSSNGFRRPWEKGKKNIDSTVLESSKDDVQEETHGMDRRKKIPEDSSQEKKG